MKGKVEIEHDRYADIEYTMFAPSSGLRIMIKIMKALLFPAVIPFVLLAKASPKTGFRMTSELFSLIPFSFGEIIRHGFYRRVLRSCGNNVYFSFGTVLYYPEISIGENVLIGMYNTIHHCDFGNDVMTAEGCRFLSGSKYHTFARIDIPMTQQRGKLKRIKVGNDVWIGANSVIMDDIQDGSVVGAGSVVTRKVEPYTIVVGNPAQVVRKRK